MKVSIRFFGDKEVRTVWDELGSSWRFSVIDIIGVLRNNVDHNKNRNYWKYLKAKLIRENNQLVSATTQLKLKARDGKFYNTDTLNAEGVIELAKSFPAKEASRFIVWFIDSEDSLDNKSKTRAYSLFESELMNSIEVGTIKGLQQIHSHLFGGLYDFAGQIRTKNIAKGGFKFAPAEFLTNTLNHIEKMPHTTFQEIVTKYVEMNIAHPFMEGNGRSMRVWLDLMLKDALALCVDWSKVPKREYLQAMEKSVVNTKDIEKLLQTALTSKINDREVFMKGIDYSYYYEEEHDVVN
ncbi:MAG: Fic family protein [Bacillota bacterium]|nr:Fic family protein [Bacillota bacterium]